MKDEVNSNLISNKTFYCGNYKKQENEIKEKTRGCASTSKLREKPRKHSWLRLNLENPGKKTHAKRASSSALTPPMQTDECTHSSRDPPQH